MLLSAGMPVEAHEHKQCTGTQHDFSGLFVELQIVISCVMTDKETVDERNSTRNEHQLSSATKEMKRHSGAKKIK